MHLLLTINYRVLIFEWKVRIASEIIGQTKWQSSKGSPKPTHRPKSITLTVHRVSDVLSTDQIN